MIEPKGAYQPPRDDVLPLPTGFSAATPPAPAAEPPALIQPPRPSTPPPPAPRRQPPSSRPQPSSAALQPTSPGPPTIPQPRPTIPQPRSATPRPRPTTPRPLRTALIGFGSVGLLIAGFTTARTIGAFSPNPTPITIPSPGPTSPKPKPHTPKAVPRPRTPAQAASLSRRRAEHELRLEAKESSATVRALRGSWVAQVSSKCTGVPADLRPGWLPDGDPETAAVTTAQIAAFNVSMHQHWGAVTALPTGIGLERNTAKSGLCRGKVTWMSVVPIRFAEPDDANAWCDEREIPVAECFARSVVGPGGRSEKVQR